MKNDKSCKTHESIEATHKEAGEQFTFFFLKDPYIF